MTDIDEKIKIIEAYGELLRKLPYGYGDYPDKILETCEMLKAFGWEWGHKTSFTDFRIRKGYYITNNATGHKSNPSEWYVEWDNGNIGAYQFVRNDSEYYAVQDEFREFRAELMKYNPVNYDNLNCHIIFDVENGKRLLEDYPAILKRTREKMNAKIKQVQLAKAKAEYEKLCAEMEGAQDD